MQLKSIPKIILGLVALSQLAYTQEVLHHPDSSQTVDQRWAWAKEQAGQLRFKKGYWIGYSIQRLMEENSTIGSMHIKNGRVYRGPGKSLSELIYGIPTPMELSSAEVKSHRKVMKEVGIFFLIDPKTGALAEVKESTFLLSVDFEGFPVLWLWEAGDEQSLTLLEQLYRQAPSSKVKEDLICAVGIHNPSTRRRTFLAGILSGDEANAVRKQAAFWLGQNGDAEAVRILRQTARTDRSMEVRKQAVFALSQTKSDESIAALVELAKNESSGEIRKEALFWLAQTHSEQAVSMLKEAVQRDDDFEVQKHAVFAITQLSKHQSVPLLVDIAKNHPKWEIRKEGLFWLAQTHSEQAVSTLKEAVQRDDDFEVQKHAVFAITQLSEHQSVSLLIDIAKNHPQWRIRKEAIFWLGQSDDPRAAEALLKIVQGQ